MPIKSFDIGDIVKLYNHDHVWHDEIAIVVAKRDTNTPYEESGILVDDPGDMQREYIGGGSWYRIELLGRMIWVPDHWLIPTE